MVEETEQVEQKILSFNIRKYILKAPKTGRAKKAAKVLKYLLKKHLKADVKLSDKLNKYIWSRGIKNPPVKYKLKAIKKDNYYFVELFDDNTGR